MSFEFQITEDPRFRISTASGGETQFPVPFPFQKNADIRVVRQTATGEQTVLAEGADYTLTGAGAPQGGTVTLKSAALPGQKIIRVGNALVERVTSIVREGRYSSASLDNDLDRAVIMLMEFRRDNNRAWKAPLGQNAGEIAVGAPGTVPLFSATGLAGGGPSVTEIAHAENHALAAREWAGSPDPVSPAAGGDGATDRSAKWEADRASARAAEAASDAQTAASAAGNAAADSAAAQLAAQLSGAKLFPTIAAGLAATEDEDIFMVHDAFRQRINIYLNDNGEPVYRDRFFFSSDEAARLARQQVDNAEIKARAIVSSWQSFVLSYQSGAYLPAYPATYAPITIYPDPPALTTLGEANRDVVLKRIEQFASMEWTAVADMPARETSEDGDVIEQGTEFTGPPYSSVKDLGKTIVQDISYETFLTAAMNPDADLYTVVLNELPGSSGDIDRTIYGAVCSSFLSYGFGWFFSPTTGVLSRSWQDWGFEQHRLDGFWGIDDLALGYIVVSEGGGHIEIISEITETTITTFDQAARGPRNRTWQKTGPDSFMVYARGRNYSLLIPDYNNMDELVYEPSPFVPLPGESLDPPVYNDVLMLNRGNKYNYVPGQEIRFNIVSDDVTALVIFKDEVQIESVVTAGEEIITRSYAEEGDYSAHCVMSDESDSDPVEWKVASITASADRTEATPDDWVAVTFLTENCTAHSLFLYQVSSASFTPGIIHKLTDTEIANGEARFRHSRPGNYRIRLRATNIYGDVMSEPHDAMLLEITGD